MLLDTLIEASLGIRIHAFVALAAFLIGAIQLFGNKETVVHRLFG